MYVELQNIFASDSVGRGEVEDQSVGVEDIRRRFRIVEGSKGSIPRFWDRFRRAKTLVDLLYIC